jgi:hypothetical protein
MSMRIQDALSNCCEGIKDFASSTASWIGKTVTATGAFFTESATKVAEFVKPHFENIKTFAQENQQSIVIAAAAFTIGAIATAVITNVFCRGTNTTPATSSTTA